MHLKYGKLEHIAAAKCKITDNMVWKRICKARGMANQYIFWRLEREDIFLV